MKRGEGDRRVLVAWLMLGASCTEPTFQAREDADTVVAAPDAGNDPREADAATSEASVEIDSAVEAGMAPAHGGEDAAVAVNDADVSTGEAEVPAPDAGGGAADPDAATAQDSEVGSPTPELPAWAKPLIGRYLKQSINVGLDTAIGMPIVSSERSLVTIVEEANAQLAMRIEVCSFNSQWLDQSLRLALVKPSALPVVKLRVILGEAPHFTTETLDRAVGFDPARQASCGGMGQRIDKFRDQVWLSGSTCICPTYPELPPQSSTDCRLTDPDGDRQPGVLITSTTGVFTFSIAMSTSLKVVDGVVAADREHTLREQGRANVSCVNALEDGCTLGAPKPCGEVTDLRPLPDDATCAAVLAYNLPVGTLPVDKCPTK